MNNFYMPAEWEKHSATILGWPSNEDDWPGKMHAVEHDYCEYIRHLSQSETVKLICYPQKIDSAKLLLEKAGVDLNKVDFIPLETNRVWTRDSGPIFVKNSTTKKIIKFNFNAWAKYSDYQLDQRIPDMIAAKYSYQIDDHSHFTLEGGAIDVNGEGTLLATKECLLDFETQVRNPGLDQLKIENQLAVLGVSQVIWLDHGIAGDDTHGHIDDFCRFVATDTVVLAEEKNPDDYNHAVLESANNALKDITLVNGKKLKVVRIPMPGPVYYDNIRLPASYANFLITNKSVLVPTFNDPNDRIALSILAELFPERKVIGIHAVNLVWGLGTLHCLSQQEPAL